MKMTEPEKRPNYTERELIRLFSEALEDIEHWGSYASDFFKDKYGYLDCLEKYKKIIRELKDE